MLQLQKNRFTDLALHDYVPHQNPAGNCEDQSRRIAHSSQDPILDSSNIVPNLASADPTQ